MPGLQGVAVVEIDTVLDLVATDRVRLDLQVPQERFAALAGEATVQVYPDALAGDALPARIEARVPVTDPQARTFLLRLRVDDADGRLLPGTSARAWAIRLAIWASPRSGAGRSARSSQGRMWPCRSVVARMRKVTRGCGAAAPGAGTLEETRKSSLTAVSAMGQGCLTFHAGSLRVPPPGYRAKAGRGSCLFWNV